jgi:acyl-CoA synthetase
LLLTLHHPSQSRRFYEQGHWREESLYRLLSMHAHARPNDAALRDASHRLTWQALLAWVDRLADQLAELDLRRGDRVAVWLPSRAESVVSLLACSRMGYVCCPSFHQNYTVSEIITLLERSAARVLIAQRGYGADASMHDLSRSIGEANALDKTCLRKILWVDAVHPQAPIDERFCNSVSIYNSLRPADLDPDKVVYLAFTSGTTGTPKGVMHSDNSLLANGRAMVKDWSHDHRTVLLSLSPMSHHIGTVAVEQQLVAGMELVLNDPRTKMHPLDWIIASDAGYVMGVPTHAIDVLAELKQRNLNQLGSVKLFYMAGSPIAPELAAQFLAMGITPQNIYGMTENGSHQYTLPNDDARTIVETCGRAAPGFECVIVDAEQSDKQLPPNQIGEIASRGALLMLGYFDHQRATEQSFNREGWFLSGDLGVLDERGCLRIVGRKKDLVIRGGHNIHPAGVEHLALKHPHIVKAAAFGVADQRLGEKLCLAVIARGQASIDPNELLSNLASHGLSKFDMPEYFLQLDHFPLTASGKILKRELAEQVKAGALKPIPVRFKAEAQAGSAP